MDTQASCLEQLGKIEAALSIAAKLISSHKTSPIGYLRMGKLLRLQKELVEADKFYKIGLAKADKKDKMYEVLDRQYQTVQKLLQSMKSEQTSSIAEAKDQIYGKGHLLSLPLCVLNQICSQLNKSNLKSFVSTCNFTFSNISRELLVGSFGIVDLRLLKNYQLYSKLMREQLILESFNQSSILKINSNSATLLFLMYLKKNMASLKKRIRVANLCIGPMRKESLELLQECVTRGLNIMKLRINTQDYAKTNTKEIIEMKNLKELVIDNYANDIKVNIVAANLECLTINGDEGNREFCNCKHLKCLVYPKESNLNSFNSAKIILASLKYDQSITMRPRPIQYLCLNGHGSNTTPYSCIDLTQYSYESIKVLHLEGIFLNSFPETDLIKSSCWNNLECLRMTRIMLQNPQRDLTWILSKCPKELKILELVSLPLSGLNDFNSNENGTWLIDLIFKRFVNLEHLILGDLTLGPAANNLLMKFFLQKKLKHLKVFGMIKIQSTGYNYDQLYQTIRLTYPWSVLLVNDRQYIEYSEEFNLFKNGRIFLH